MSQNQKSKARTRSTTLVDLTPDDVRHLLRPPKGFETFPARLIAVFRANPKVLSTDGLDVDGMLESVQAYQALAEQESTAQQQLTRVSNSRLKYASDGWQVVLELYARAIAAGRTNAAVRNALADFIEFMRHTRKNKTKKSTPPSSNGTPTPSTT